jgi:hypothetical protein
MLLPHWRRPPLAARPLRGAEWLLLAARPLEAGEVRMEEFLHG